MLKTLMISIGILLTSVVHDWTAEVILPKMVEKRFHRNIQKIFKGEDYIKTALTFSDSLIYGSSYFYSIENKDKTQRYIASITLANGCKVGGCDISGKSADEYEVFYIYTLYSDTGQLIEVKILDYQSDYGYEITSKWWLNQFIKHQDAPYEYSKNIDAISGATTSVKSTIKEMNRNKQIVTEMIAN